MTAIAAGSITSPSIPITARKGYGRAIMNAAEDWLRAAGIAKLQLMVRRDNARVARVLPVDRLRRGSRRIVFAKWLDGREPTP